MFSKLLLSLMLAVTPSQSPISNKTEGLEITAPQEVLESANLVTVEAKINGTVKWLVVSQEKIKYQESNSAIIISTPKAGKITVFAIGCIDGNLTDFTTTTINVKKQEKKKPEENPAPLLDYKMRWR